MANGTGVEPIFVYRRRDKGVTIVVKLVRKMKLPDPGSASVIRESISSTSERPYPAKFFRWLVVIATSAHDLQ